MWQQLKNVYHLVVAVIANFLYDFPSRKLSVIGITGTDGKTTTASLIYHILHASGKHVSLISTVGAVINGKSFDTGFHVTTPGSFALQRYLKRAVDEKSRFVILEATSHGLDQNRLYGIDFTLGLITNITHEHLDYHKTFERYMLAKTKLLKRAKKVFLNRDDESYQALRDRCETWQKDIVTYGEKEGDYTFTDIKGHRKGISGEHNAYNLLAAVSIARELGITDAVIAGAVRSFTLPKGRSEIVYSNGFTIIIDFAHTPNGLHQFLKSVSEQKGSGRIIHVFGAAGERDRSKRPMMGEVASKFDDYMVLTSEDPRSESPEKIIQEIASGVIQIGTIPQVQIVPDRQKAIIEAVRLAEKNDIVVITGKGHEESMNFGRGEEPWTDHEAVTLALQKRHAA